MTTIAQRVRRDRFRALLELSETVADESPRYAALWLLKRHGDHEAVAGRSERALAEDIRRARRMTV